MYLVIGLGEYMQPKTILAFGGDEHKIADCIQDLAKQGEKVALFETVEVHGFVARVRAKKCRICGQIATHEAGGVNLCDGKICNKKFIKDIEKYTKEVEKMEAEKNVHS